MRALLMCWAWTAAGCGGGRARDPGDADADVDADSDTDSDSDGDGDADGDADLPEGVLRTSYVTADSYSSAGFSASLVIAAFYDQDPAPLQVTIEDVGPCEVRTVRFTEDAAFPRYADAGTITIEGAAEPVELVPTAGGYETYTAEVALWQGGETLRFVGSGGEVGAFEVEVPAPNHLRITDPSYPLGGSLELPADEDIVVAWEGESAGAVVVTLQGPQALPEPQTIVECRFEASEGRGNIPAEAVDRITLTGTGTISADVRSTSSADADGWGDVAIYATAAALSPTGGRWGTTVEY